MKRRIAVIGGGAAGMMAAVMAARAGALVQIYERNDRVGKKILVTGNGKCNFSNLNMSKEAYYGSAVLLYDKCFAKFGVEDTVDFFSQCGMLIKNKDGCLYPFSQQASTVLDVLRLALDEHGVRIYTNAFVKSIKLRKEDKKLGVAAHETEFYDAVILACGGSAAPSTGSDGNGFKLAKSLGHHITDTVPALVQLRCSEDFFKSVAGVRTDAELTLCIDDEKSSRVRGELQLTDYGISGIPVFQFSREAAYALLHKRKVTVDIDFLPDYDEASCKRFFEERWKRQAGQPMEKFLTGIVNKKINSLIIRLSGARVNDKASDVSPDVRHNIERLYKKLTVTVRRTNGFDHAQVCAGGIPYNELTDELESKLVPGLYFAGELIDIDGICGGYNLQWAWTSGAIAGMAAAGKALK